MSSITKSLLAAFTLQLIFFSVAGADTVNRVFRCSGEKIENGDTTFTVLKNCGEPAYKEVITTEEDDEKIEKWHYDCKGRGNVEVLIFQKGILTERTRGEESQGTQTCR